MQKFLTTTNNKHAIIPGTARRKPHGQTLDLHERLERVFYVKRDRRTILKDDRMI